MEYSTSLGEWYHKNAILNDLLDEYDILTRKDKKKVQAIYEYLVVFMFIIKICVLINFLNLKFLFHHRSAGMLLSNLALKLFRLGVYLHRHNLCFIYTILIKKFFEFVFYYSLIYK